jgi:hypothetical protein
LRRRRYIAGIRGEVLGRLVPAEHPAVRSRALKAVGGLGDASLRANVESALRDADGECRFAAAWSGALLGHAGCAGVAGDCRVRFGAPPFNGVLSPPGISQADLPPPAVCYTFGSRAAPAGPASRTRA